MVGLRSVYNSMGMYTSGDSCTNVALEHLISLRKLPVKASDPTCLSETHAAHVVYGLTTPGVLYLSDNPQGSDEILIVCSLVEVTTVNVLYLESSLFYDFRKTSTETWV